MWEFLQKLFDSSGFVPRRICGDWSPGLLWLHNGSDLLIWLAYLAIPVALIYFVRRRGDLPAKHLFVLFGLFIIFCGFTHLMDVIMFYRPVYRLSGVVKLATAGVSWVTVIALLPVIPVVLALRSPQELERINVRLQAEIAERRKAEQELAEKHRLLQETERLKSEFFANVSHELRTPLTLILSPLESLLAREPAAGTPENRAVLQTTHNNAIRLLQMVNGLLDFSKLESGRFEVRREPVDLTRLTEVILKDFAPLLNQRGLACRFEPEPDRIAGRADRYLYERILFNLLSNAVKFTPKGGRIGVGLRRDGERVRLSVTDTGIGIPEVAQKDLFLKYRQLDGSSTRRFEGTGLGLAMVREFAELQGGSASVESRAGEGSAFHVEFIAPACAPPGEEAAAVRSGPVVVPQYPAEAAAPGAPAAPGEGRPRILVAEDNRELAVHLAGMLAPIGDVRIAGDGDEALAAVREWLPDAVLCDVMMPKRDGLDVCRAVKADPTTSFIPVILLTALTDREALIRGWRAGADEYLFKPFHPEELLARVRSILSSWTERKRAQAALVKRAADLQRANEELDAFSYTVSHDLRAPLRSLEGFSNILLEDYADRLDETGRDYARRISGSAKRMDAMIQDLLQYSRLYRAELPLTPLPLGEVVAEARQQVEAELFDKSAVLTVDASFPEVQGHRPTLVRVLANLLANAVKFVPPGVEPRVRVRGERKAGTVRLWVEDNGIGIAAEHQGRLFRVFERLHKDEYPGTGIGLAVVQKGIERMGGRVGVESEPGKGSRFWIELNQCGG